jgi:hypothetical protein
MRTVDLGPTWAARISLLTFVVYVLALLLIAGIALA